MQKSESKRPAGCMPCPKGEGTMLSSLKPESAVGSEKYPHTYYRITLHHHMVGVMKSAANITKEVKMVLPFVILTSFDYNTRDNSQRIMDLVVGVIQYPRKGKETFSALSSHAKTCCHTEELSRSLGDASNSESGRVSKGESDSSSVLSRISVIAVNRESSLSASVRLLVCFKQRRANYM